MFCISPEGQESIIDVATVEAIEPTIRLLKPGKYHVDEIAIAADRHFKALGCRDQAVRWNARN